MKQESEINIQEEEILATNVKNKKKIIKNLLIVIVLVLSAQWIAGQYSNHWFFDNLRGLFNLTSIILVGDIILFTPIGYNRVKKSLIEKEEKKRKEEEEKKLIAEKRKIDQEESGSKLDYTEYSRDKFDGVNYLSTIRYGSFKSAGLTGTTHNSINQSICLHDWEMQLPSIRLKKHMGLYASILRMEKEGNKKYFLEFLFITSDLTNNSSSDSQISGENCCLEILSKDGKISIESILVENKKDENKFDLTHSMIKINQKFRFDVSYDLLKSISTSEVEMRFSDFNNMKRGGDNIWEFTIEMRNALQKLIQEFIRDIE